MLRGLFFKRLETEAFSSVRHLRPVEPENADGSVQAVYRQVRRDFGLLVAPMTLHSPVPDLLAAVWMVCRETLFCGRLPQAQREVVSAAVSRANRCPFCVEVHTMSLQALGFERESAALSAGAALPPGEAADLARWAAASGRSDCPVFLPDDPGRFAEVAALAVGFHYINRMVSIFLPESVLPVPARFPRLKALSKRLAARMVRPLALRRRQEGLGIDLLPPASLPVEFAWAAADERMAQALGRSAAAFAAAGEVLPAGARRRVEDRLAVWEGENMPLGSAWLEEALGDLHGAERAAARLGLLAALAAYRVDDAEVAAFRGHWPADEDLLRVCAWGAFAAVRRIGSWLRPPV